jgi:3-hydroxy-3-methylglutaryl CoA synthase
MSLRTIGPCPGRGLRRAVVRGGRPGCERRARVQVGWPDPFPLMRDGKYSVDCYMDCLAGCVRALEAAKGEPGFVVDRCDYFVNHCTSTYLCKRAFMKTLELHEEATGAKFGLKQRAELYETRGGPAARLTKRIGSTYTASVFVNLYSLLCAAAEAGGPAAMEGKRVSVFSYGSGATSTMYHFVGRRGAGAVRLDRTVFERLGRRRAVSVADFRRLADAYSGMYGGAVPWARPQPPLVAPPDDYPRRYVLEAIDEHGVRAYGDVGAAEA